VRSRIEKARNVTGNAPLRAANAIYTVTVPLAGPPGVRIAPSIGRALGAAGPASKMQQAPPTFRLSRLERNGDGILSF